MSRLLPVAAALLLSAIAAVPAQAKDDLLETLAQKGVLTVNEYEKLKAQRRSSEVTVNADDGFRISSADGASSIQLGTLQQLDYAGYCADKADLADGTLLRRSRLSVAGTFFRDWQYRVEYEFAGTTALTDAYVVWTALQPLILTVGQFKQPFGMEALASDKNVSFMERGLPFAFVTTRAPGVQLGSSGSNWSLNAGVFGEPLGNAQAGDEGFGGVARGSWAPWLKADQLIHLGFGAVLRYPTQDGSSNASGPKFQTVRFQSKPESNVLSQFLVTTGEIREVERYRLFGPEFAAQLGALSLQAEGHFVQVDRKLGSTLDFSGWYAQLAYTLTGEARPYRAERGTFDSVRAARPFAAGGGWGAFEIAARVSGIDLSNGSVHGGQQRDATLALSWYLNPQLRISANLVKVLAVDGGAFNDDEPTAYQMRFQLVL